MVAINWNAIWTAAEQNMVRRERQSRIRRGLIVPAYKLRPQMMVKDETGRWCPQLEIK